MRSHTLGTLLVALQFGILLVLFWLVAARLTTALPGGPAWMLWALSALLGAWTLSANRPGNFNIHPSPKAGGQLVQHGPYRWVRHPMYTSVLLLAAGCGSYLATVTGWGLCLALVAVLATKAWQEERMLLAAYPGYADYRARTRRFIPYLL